MRTQFLRFTSSILIVIAGLAQADVIETPTAKQAAVEQAEETKSGQPADREVGHTQNGAGNPFLKTSDDPDQPAEGKAADPQELKLNGVTVEGKRNPLDDRDKHLKQLQESLPCSGCDVPPRKKKFLRKVLDKALDEVTPQEAPDHSHEVNDQAQDFSQQGRCISADVNQCTPENAKP